MSISSEKAPALSAAKAACWVFIATGIALGLAPVLGLQAVLGFLLDLVFWPVDGAQSAAAPETRLAAGIAGGLLAGWGVTLLAMLRHAPEPGGWAVQAMGRALLIWFVLDGVASVASGAWANVIGNLVFLGALGVPVLVLMRGARPAVA